MKWTYSGEGERVFPTLGVTVNKGDTFDGPDDLSADQVAAASTKPVPVVSADPVVDAGVVNG